MKYMIASDIHGSAYYCKKTVEAFERENADRLILLGDLLYHGPRNDLPREYDPKQVIEMLNSLSDRIICVRGNCDSEVDQMVLSFPILADYAVIDAGERLIFATHGHIYSPQSPPAMKSGDILLCGHTHVPKCEEFGGGCTYINPGSVSIPKENSAHGYMTLEGGVFEWKDMDGNVFDKYSL